MSKTGLVLFLVLALFCTTIFLGCATVPKEELQEKDAIIKNLNSQVETLRQEVATLQAANKELKNIIAEFEDRLKKMQEASTPVKKTQETKVK